MKKIAILIFLLANVSFSQSFFENTQDTESPPQQNEQSGFFDSQTSKTIEARSPGNPEFGVSIDTDLFMLIIGAIVLGAYFLNSRKRFI